MIGACSNKAFQYIFTFFQKMSLSLQKLPGSPLTLTTLIIITRYHKKVDVKFTLHLQNRYPMILCSVRTYHWVEWCWVQQQQLSWWHAVVTKPSPGSQSPTAALWCGLTEVCLIEPINLLVTEQSTINILRPVNKLPLSLTITKTVTEPISYI